MSQPASAQSAKNHADKVTQGKRERQSAPASTSKQVSAGRVTSKRVGLALIAIFAFLAVSISGLGIATVNGVFAQQLPLEIESNLDGVHGLRQPVVVTFSLPVSFDEAAKMTLDGEKGTVEALNTWLIPKYATRYAFTPDKALRPNTEYRIDVSQVRSLAQSTVDATRGETVVPFTTVPFPSVVGVLAGDLSLERQSVVSEEQSDLSAPNASAVSGVDGLQTTDAQSSGRVILASSVSGGASTSSSASSSSTENSADRLVLDSESFADSTRNLSEMPSTEAIGDRFTSSQRVGIDTPLTLQLQDVTQDFTVDVEWVGGLTPDEAVQTVQQTQTDTTLRLEPNTTWKQGTTIDARVRFTSVHDSSMSHEQAVVFSTPPAVHVVASAPGNGVTAAPIIAPIAIEFDRPVKQEGVDQYIRVEPAKITGRFEWQTDRIVHFIPDTFLPTRTTVTVTVLPGIEALNDPGVMESEHVISFTTRYGNGRAVPQPTKSPKQTQGRHVEVDLTRQVLYAYENGDLVNAFLVSTGLPGYETPAATYQVTIEKPVTRYKWEYGPDDPRNYDIPNVRWNMKLSNTNYFLHSAYWHNNFGVRMSHGCVNISIPDAEWLYKNFVDVGTPVYIYY